MILTNPNKLFILMTMFCLGQKKFLLPSWNGMLYVNRKQTKNACNQVSELTVLHVLW